MGVRWVSDGCQRVQHYQTLAVFVATILTGSLLLLSTPRHMSLTLTLVLTLPLTRHLHKLTVALDSHKISNSDPCIGPAPGVRVRVTVMVTVTVRARARVRFTVIIIIRARTLALRPILDQ